MREDEYRKFKDGLFVMSRPTWFYMPRFWIWSNQAGRGINNDE